MCGITACIGSDDAVDSLLDSLQNLEYRGYDSAGIGLMNGDGIEVKKSEGRVDELRSMVNRDRPTEGIGIGHTRWSTHGPPSDENAHPHTDCTGEVAVVHNGIIDNHNALRSDLRKRGHEFTSETDTEVVPHLVEDRLQAGNSTEVAFREAISRLEGSYALAMVRKDDMRVFATRDGSPLVLGLANDAKYLASDVPAFIDYTDQVIYLEDGDIAVVSPTRYHFTDLAGDPIERNIDTVDWDPKAAEKGGYEHYMLKEIQEQPTSLRQTIGGRVDGDAVELEDFEPGSFADVSNVQLVACGTSYHAGLYGEHLLHRWGIPAAAYLASEYAVFPPPVEDDTLVISVTQSGETADTLEALRVAKNRGARTLALTNVVGSTAVRESDDALFIRAGPEIGVAATKTFSSQVVSLVFLAHRLVNDVTGSMPEAAASRNESIRSLPAAVETVLNSSKAEAISDRFLSDRGHFFIGRGNAVPVALEGALKFKEITYRNAEGFPAGELKHGPLALVTADTPIFAVCSGQNPSKLRSAISEVQTRGAPVVAIAPRTMEDVIDLADEALTFPETHSDLMPILANVQLQLVAYFAASNLGRSIDKPRNLAKSVTVE